VTDLFFLDQRGFAPTLPTGYSWGRLGARLVVPYEAPRGRRVNAVGAFAPDDPGGPRLVFETRRKAEGRYDAAAHLAFVRRAAGLPADPASGAGRARPGVVALDNYSVHHAAAVTEAAPALAAAGVDFFYLPAYSPELNPIEPVWRQVKYQDIPERSHPTDTALQTAVEAALTDRAIRLAKPTNELPRCA
jgi:hypothetical protein